MRTLVADIRRADHQRSGDLPLYSEVPLLRVRNRSAYPPIHELSRLPVCNRRRDQRWLVEVLREAAIPVERRSDTCIGTGERRGDRETRLRNSRSLADELLVEDS